MTQKDYEKLKAEIKSKPYNQGIPGGFPNWSPKVPGEIKGKKTGDKTT
jgi:hypothetical protein